jgi:outer membrane immunogenic protein
VSTTTASFHGYTLGAGMDYAVTDRIFSRIDYRYNDFGTSELDFGAASIGADLTQHTVKFGLGVKF